MKGFYIHVTNNLIDPKHRNALGVAVWEFMWCLDKMTKIDTEKGTGLVLGGKPITNQEIAEDLGLHVDTIQINMKTLEDAGYIKTLRTPRGRVITVNKAKKVFKSDTEEVPPRYRESSASIGYRENTGSNIRQYSIDNTRTTKTQKDTNSDIGEIPKKFLELKEPKMMDILSREFPAIDVDDAIDRYLVWIAKTSATPKRHKPVWYFRKWLKEDQDDLKEPKRFRKKLIHKKFKRDE